MQSCLQAVVIVSSSSGAYKFGTSPCVEIVRQVQLQLQHRVTCGIQDVVDVLEHGLEDDLRVAEEKHGGLGLDARVEQDLFEGLAPACVMS